MSARASPTAVGGFLLGAMALAVAVAVIFGGGMFKTRTRYVVYFEGSVAGLNVGAPVTLRGVPIGTVEAIRLVVNRQSRGVFIPVYISVDPASITVDGAQPVAAGELTPTDIDEAIQLGLRARLQTQSIVTGQVGIEFEFLPEIPARLIGLDTSVQELPSAPSMIDALKQRLEKMPVDQIAQQFLKMLTDLDALVTSTEVHTAVTALARTGEAIQASMQNDVRPTLQALTKTLEGAQHAIGALQSLATTAGTRLNASGQALDKTLADLDLAIRQSQTTLGAINTMVQPNTPTRTNIDQMLRDLAITAQSLKGLAQELERNPNALMVGKR